MEYKCRIKYFNYAFYNIYFLNLKSSNPNYLLSNEN